jgi:hypothetical protein
MLHRVHFALLLVTLLFLASATGAQSFVRVDSKFTAVDHGASVAWLDNDRVMFRGFDHTNLAAKPRDGYDWGTLAKTYIWNTKTNEITLYRDIRPAQLCVSEGNISYLIVTEPNIRSLHFGKVGGEVAIPEPKYVARNQFDCTYEFSEPKAWVWGRANGKATQSLRAADGFLDRGHAERKREDTEEFTYRLRASDGSVKSVVNVDRQRSIRAMSYLPFRQQYLLVEDSPDTSTPRAWYMSRGGLTSQIPIPYNSLTGVTLHPMKFGIVLKSRVSKSPTDAGDAGLYWVKDGAMTRILAGIVDREGVSPSGCKIAFINSVTSDEVTQAMRRMRRGLAGNTLQMIDICVE